MKFLAKLFSSIFLLSISISTMALTFELPKNGNVVGHVQYATVSPGWDLSTIGRRYDIGGLEMYEANPGVDYLRPPVGKRLLIPSKFILPDAPKEGIVINLAELRLYYYHKDGKRVSTYPIGVGKGGWHTPIGTSSITRKRKNPTWRMPESIYKKNLAMGLKVQKVVPPGPTNPLGKHALSTGFKNIVIHGTPYPRGVGLRSSHGCLRMLPEDIAQLFNYVDVGTKVTVVHQPTKIGKLDNMVYMESHVPISDPNYKRNTNLKANFEKFSAKFGKPANFNWHKAQQFQNNSFGYPKQVGTF